MSKKKEKMNKRIFFFIVACWAVVAAGAQSESINRKWFTPSWGFGVMFDADANGLHSGRYDYPEDGPSFSASLTLRAYVGEVSDVFNLSFGLGYRGFWDQTPPREFVVHSSTSDYLLYSRSHEQNRDGSEVRPLGGMMVFPVDLNANFVRLGESTFLHVGCGLEFGLRLYQSKRYERFYGAHILNKSSLSYSPRVGINFYDDDNEIGVYLSVYYRRYGYGCFNYKELPFDKKFNRNSIGLQIGIRM
jgi:hypothetical protein